MTAWKPGDTAWFEYHCLEDESSADARLWHRSHGRVTITGTLALDPAAAGMNETERAEAGLTGIYIVQFEDGETGGAFEDELLTDPGQYSRPGPPAETDPCLPAANWPACCWPPWPLVLAAGLLIH